MSGLVTILIRWAERQGGFDSHRHNMNKSKLKKFVPLFSLMNAFALYKEKGEERTRRMYPEHIDFILEHRDKTLQEIQNLGFEKFKLKDS